MDHSAVSSMTAAPSRGDAVHGDVPNDYAVILPTLPTGEAMKCSLVLHADTRGRPYRAEDFVGPLNQCRAFGREASDCVRSYARAAASKVIDSQDRNLVMDEEEAEAAATPTARISSRDPQAFGEQQRAPLAMPEGQVTVVALTAESTIGENEPNAKTASETTPTAKDASDALDAGDETAMNFAAEAVKRRLSDTEEGTDQSLQQTESPWLVVTSKRERHAGRSRSSSLPR
ncbi:hypothetical protein HPB47_001961 [Ixodes persulcatus]|uniref:Uncharacterized protein n=1 Tax=Ixodes persulcatus TaxID=34615 RepID=A0AC60PMN8_IXOPE|nr:hypothetical protein HPB47_001961 [Ixodes persulcatus]